MRCEVFHAPDGYDMASLVTTTQFREMLGELTGMGLLAAPMTRRGRALTAGSRNAPKAGSVGQGNREKWVMDLRGESNQLYCSN